jgi:predicted nucleotide-binding protein (sugar kinase/HSP70/actin superfamily)
MPNTSYTEVIKEAYALAPQGEMNLHTLELSHPDLVEVIYLVLDRASHTLKVEGGASKLFEACPFRFNLPQMNDNGLQELTVAIDNIDQRISDFLEAVKESNTAVTMIYRPYLLSDPDTPQALPLELALTDISVDDIQATGKATFADLVNKAFLTMVYGRDRFPGLGNG